MHSTSTPASAPLDSAAHPARATALAALLQGIGGGLGWSLLPPLMPRIAADLHIDHTMGGLVWGAAPLGIALAAPLGGAAVDRHGPRRVAGVAMLLGALACAARALTTGPWSLAFTMLLFGAHIGFVAPALPKLLAGHVAPARLGRANGIALTAYTFMTAVTVASARYLVPALGGWRPTMIAAGALMAVAGLTWLAFAEDRRAGAGSRHSRLIDVLALWKHPGLLRVSVVQFLLFGGYLALLGLLPRALSDAGVSPTRIGIAVSGWLAAAALANLAGPWLSDRFGRRRPFVLVGATVAAAALAVLALLPPSAGLPALLVAALGGGAFAPLLFTLPLELPGIGPARAGAAMGFLMLVGQVGGFTLPIIVGAAVQHGGFACALALLAGVHALIVIPALGLPDHAQDRRQVA